MDNGQTTPINPNPFFTDGVGNNPVANNPDLQNGLNTESDTLKNQPIERDIRGIGNMTGNVAFGQPNQLNAEIPTMSPENQTGMGEVVNLEMPPGMEANAEVPTLVETPDAPASDGMSYNADNIVVAKEKLPKSGIREVDISISNFDKDHDIAKFYETTHGMRETYLEKMRGKELGQE